VYSIIAASITYKVILVLIALHFLLKYSMQLLVNNEYEFPSDDIISNDSRK